MPPVASRIRPVVACAASLAISVRFYSDVPASGSAAMRLFTLGTLALPCVAATLLWSRRLAAQLLARGMWWSMLLFGALLSAVAGADGRNGAFVATCAAIALLAAGTRGLESRGRFTPVAFRGTLLLALLFAVADASAFAWFGTGNAIFEHRYAVLAMVLPMTVGVVGLLRLRTWGLVVGLTTNLTIVILALTQVLNLPSPLRQLFIGSATLQMIIPLPMIVAIARGKAAQADPRPRRSRTILPALVVVAIAAFSLYAAFRHGGPLLPS